MRAYGGSVSSPRVGAPPRLPRCGWLQRRFLRTPTLPLVVRQWELVAYNSEDSRRFSVVNANTQVETQLRVPDSLGSWYVGGALSPDGRQMVVSTLRQWNDWGELWLAQLDNGEWQRLRSHWVSRVRLRWTSAGWLYLLNHRFVRRRRVGLWTGGNLA
jgi:hypothetical protein